jgi:hypothetical protein
MSETETDELAAAERIIRALLRDLLSPFPREAAVIASLGMGGSSIEQAQSWLHARQVPQ